MKKLLIAAIIVLMATGVWASPFLVCDGQVGVSSYTFSGDAFFISPHTSEVDGSLRYDLVGLPNGVHNLNIVACNLWGCSAATPFSFSKSVPAMPANLRVILGQ